MKKLKKNNFGTAASEDLEQKKKARNASIIKLSVMLALTVIMLIFSSTAWFTMNREVEETGTSFQADGVPFTIEFPGSDEGKWIDQYRTLSSQSGIWLVAENHNFDNGSNTTEDKLGLEPGDSGILEFRVKPNDNYDSIQVDICFTIRAIEKPSQQNDTEGTEELPLVEITETSPELMKMLASHIMLFTDIDENGKYTGLIENDAELKRYLKNQTYNKDDTTYTQLYWKWPLHLSDIISNQENELIYDKAERTEVINYIVANKSGFFKDITKEDEELMSDLTNVEHYGSYSIMFDKADLEIGRNVQYVIMGLSVTLSDS
ncbi:hypothetical protein [uncultured Ruminococcus sp.]|uniref:hypothetical protein n=1 Tax=uncultured Ruminococcus sp. TaxID=165186 RepID=UPI00262AC959|nr:hypothetical protein [uncultured Ruminococcus sp.]